MNTEISTVDVNKLHEVLKFNKPINYPESSLEKPLNQWKMEIDDSPIFRYIYQNFQPKRHLEFGTWQGSGTMYCLEETDATIWTINLPFGENGLEGAASYGNYPEEASILQEWAGKIGIPKQKEYRTDSIGFIGRNYLMNGLGHRVCQVYCDSRLWVSSNYPEGYFDTILIDGGHQTEIVISDTKKAIPLLRSGGIIMWHDFCPPVWDQFVCTRGVMQAIIEQREMLFQEFKTLFWIKPSWILVGVKK